jgi:hypothetical protein
MLSRKTALHSSALSATARNASTRKLSPLSASRPATAAPLRARAPTPPTRPQMRAGFPWSRRFGALIRFGIYVKKKVFTIMALGHPQMPSVCYPAAYFCPMAIFFASGFGGSGRKANHRGRIFLGGRIGRV